LINGVFLVALCLSIFLEAIQRFVEPQVVSNPKLVLVVGSLGLLSNVLGLFLFHDHGHSHGGGGGGHSHGHGDEVAAAEEGHSHANGHSHSHDDEVADENGRVADIMPGNIVARQTRREFNTSDESSSTTVAPTMSTSPVSRKTNGSGSAHGHRRKSSRSRYFSDPNETNFHPVSFRNSVITASRLEDIDSDERTDDSEPEAEEAVEVVEASENSPLLAKNSKGSTKKDGRHDSWHNAHKHNEPADKKAGGSGGHSHDLNMRGVFLHVLGDALGNIGVIAAALFIWLTDYSWRYYSDPLISLIITVIILISALPLCKAASKILLQAVPAHINVEDLTDDIEELPGIVSCHHVHVWQLSDSKTIATLHVQVDFDFEGEGATRYMNLAREIQACLHAYGIHSSTIQPEFPRHNNGKTLDHLGIPIGGQPKKKSPAGSAIGSPDGQNACLLSCQTSCGDANQCCAPAKSDDEHSQHSH
jgi:solute carrier family 30 (zinc transporter), member 1